MNVALQDDNKVHEGYNLKRVREIMGHKQSTLGDMCQSKYSQQRISEFENMWLIDTPILEELAEALGVSAEFIRSFKEEKAIYNIQTNKDTSTQNSLNYQPTISYAADKLTDLLERFILNDQAKTESIANLNKVILDLTEEVKNLKKGK